MFFRVVMIGWCFALTVVAAANYAPTQVAPQELLSPAASMTDCGAAQLSVHAGHEAGCSCSKGRISSSLAAARTDSPKDLPPPAVADLSQAVTLAVAIAEPDISQSAGGPLASNEPTATSKSKNDAALVAYLARRETWGRYPSKSTADSPSAVETAVESSGTRKSAMTATAIELPNNAIIALSVDSLEDLFRVRESWRSGALEASKAPSLKTAQSPDASEDALKDVSGEAVATKVPSSDQQMANSRSETNAALAAVLAERESWGKAPSKSTADALPRSLAQAEPTANGFADAASINAHEKEDVRASIARRETSGKSTGGKTAAVRHPRAAHTQSPSLADAKLTRKASAEHGRKRSHRTRRLRARSLQRRKSVRAFSTQRTWQERVLFPL
jgi:hypothetical protein